MVTCYEEQIPTWYVNFGVDKNGQDTGVKATLDGNTYPGLSSWQLAMLMKWAKNDPVSEKETNRNNAVYGIQNNRNPFIDYPGLEEYIWGDKQDVAFSYDNYNGSAAIYDVQTNTVSGQRVIYNLRGQRVTNPTRGIYIVDGRKVVIGE